MTVEARIVRCQGPRALQLRLLDDLADLLVDWRARTRTPVRIVVHSGPLRVHLSAAIVQRFGAVAGVQVLTLTTYARELVARAGLAQPRGACLAPILVRRAARELPGLAAALDALVDGYRPVSAAVRDLLDAGFEPAHLDALVDALAAPDGAGALLPDEQQRVEELLQVAADVHDALQRLDLGHRGQLLSLARQAVEQQGAHSAGPLLVAGFDDGPGLTADLLRALLQRADGGRMYLDAPLDPADPTRPDPGNTFADDFGRRLGIAQVTVAAPLPTTRFRALRAPTPGAEARAIAVQLRLHLDAGEPAERLMVVARDLAPHAVALRRELLRLGVPFHMAGASAPPGAAQRRVVALVDLLVEGPDAAVDTLLDAGAGRGLPLADLRVGLRVLGLLKLQQLADADLPADDVVLPVRQGLWLAEGADVDADRNEVAPRRRLPASALHTLQERARVVLAGRPAGDAPAGALRAGLDALVGAGLCWGANDRVRIAVAAALDALDGQLPAALVLAADEAVELVARALQGVGQEDGGGPGAGVAVLGVTEARGRTADRTYVIGLQRGAFPRTATDDPLLPDTARRLLRDVLPDLPLKSAAVHEERFLFAQLLDSAADVHLSWSEADDLGRPLAASPFVERLRWSGRCEQLTPQLSPPLAPSLRARPQPGAVHPPDEHAVTFGLNGDRDAWQRALGLALDADPPPSGRPDGRAAAQARRAILDEMDPDLSTPDGRARRTLAGPYLGFVGAAAAGDARLGALYVTRVEAIAGCAWQALLQGVLRLEPPLDPDGALPNLGGAVEGQVLHDVLEQLVLRAGGASGPLDGPAAPVPWPEPAALDALLHQVAAQVLMAEGAHFPGLPAVLATRVRPRLAMVQALDWAGGPVPVVSVEGEARVPLRLADDRVVDLHFRVDRADAGPDGLVLTDYKTGRPLSDAARPDTRRRHLQRAVARGRSLQVVAYAAHPATGRLLHARPDAAHPVVEVGPDDADLVDALARVVAVADAAWRAGALAPRLEDPDGAEPTRCGWCAVAEACRRRDSTARRRVVAWAGGQGGHPAEALGRDLWRLGNSAPDEVDDDNT